MASSSSSSSTEEILEESQYSSSSAKWEGKSTAEIKPPFTAEQIWPLISDDFCSLHKWLPAIDSCHLVEGTPGEPGLIRHCANTSASTWANEKLLTIDNHNKHLSYQVLDNNVGFHNYVATIKLSPLLQGGCEIEWTYVLDPVEGWKVEDLRAYIDSCLLGMATNMEAALNSSYSNS